MLNVSKENDWNVDLAFKNYKEDLEFERKHMKEQQQKAVMSKKNPKQVSQEKKYYRKDVF